MHHPTNHQRETLLRMLEDTLGAHGPVTRAQATEAALYWCALIHPTADELAAILARFPETLADPGPAEDVPAHDGYPLGRRGLLDEARLDDPQAWR